jgi:hypothetical protein
VADVFEELVRAGNADPCEYRPRRRVNRARPRTQSAMLEAMEKRDITVEGMTSQLPF